MLKTILLAFFLCFYWGTAFAQPQKKIINFTFEGIRLNDVLDLPDTSDIKGLVMIVHGYGATNAVVKDWHRDVRQTMLKAGYGTFMWDKMGCGESEGVFDINQSVYSSADEVIAAIRHLKQQRIPGSAAIGLWGVSRAGWINPIVISQYPDIQFWISVSGVDGKENFNYLLEQNLLIEGMPEDSVALIVRELENGNRLFHAGGSFEEYMNATKNLRKNRFYRQFNSTETSKAAYDQHQKETMNDPFDVATGRKIYIENFEEILLNIDGPVLALFGENDRNVDWRKTRTLYENTIGLNASLTVHTFENCSHNMVISEKGGYFEYLDTSLPRKRCDGYLERMAEWLAEL